MLSVEWTAEFSGGSAFQVSSQTAASFDEVMRWAFLGCSGVAFLSVIEL